MEKFQIGDKVNFLNATGGGTVKRIIDTRMVEVTIEDGFDIPVLMSDLVLDYRSQPDRRQQVVDNAQKEIQQKQIIEEKEMDEARKSALRRFGRNAEEEGLYLAFVQEGMLSLQFIVHSLQHLRQELHLCTAIEVAVAADALAKWDMEV